MSGRFNRTGRVAPITGGPSDIGLGMAMALAAAGAGIAVWGADAYHAGAPWLVGGGDSKL